MLEVLKELGDNVEKQKMAAIGAMNLLKSIAKERESQQAKLQVTRRFIITLKLWAGNDIVLFNEGL